MICSIEEEADNILNMEDPTELITDDTIARMWDKYDTDGNGLLDRFVNMYVESLYSVRICTLLDVTIALMRGKCDMDGEDLLLQV
jgi:hypothetical protein